MKTATADAPAAVVLCSKCGVNPRANADSSNPWCKACLAKYQQEYKEMIAQRLTDQAFNRGVEAMRKTLAMEFSRHSRVTMSGAEVAAAITNAPRPTQVIEAEKESTQASR